MPEYNPYPSESNIPYESIPQDYIRAKQALLDRWLSQQKFTSPGLREMVEDIRSQLRTGVLTKDKPFETDVLMYSGEKDTNRNFARDTVLAFEKVLNNWPDRSGIFAVRFVDAPGDPDTRIREKQGQTYALQLEIHPFFKPDPQEIQQTLRETSTSRSSEKNQVEGEGKSILEQLFHNQEKLQLEDIIRALVSLRNLQEPIPVETDRRKPDGTLETVTAYRDPNVILQTVEDARNAFTADPFDRYGTGVDGESAQVSVALKNVTTLFGLQTKLRNVFQQERTARRAQQELSRETPVPTMPSVTQEVPTESAPQEPFRYPTPEVSFQQAFHRTADVSTADYLELMSQLSPEGQYNLTVNALENTTSPKLFKEALVRRALLEKNRSPENASYTSEEMQRTILLEMISSTGNLHTLEQSLKELAQQQKESGLPLTIGGHEITKIDDRLTEIINESKKLPPGKLSTLGSSDALQNFIDRRMTRDWNLRERVRTMISRDLEDVALQLEAEKANVIKAIQHTKPSQEIAKTPAGEAAENVKSQVLRALPSLSGENITVNVEFNPAKLGDGTQSFAQRLVESVNKYQLSPRVAVRAEIVKGDWGRTFLRIRAIRKE